MKRIACAICAGALLVAISAPVALGQHARTFSTKPAIKAKPLPGPTSYKWGGSLKVL